nr:hypothetical protein [Tanacetum cinerariifolium]
MSRQKNYGVTSPTRPPQPHKQCGYESLDENDDVEIESTTIAEYNLYIVKRGLKKNPLNDHSYGFTPQFVTQSPHTPNTPADKKDSIFDTILDDLFKIGSENLKRMGQENFQKNICDQDVNNISNLEKEEAQKEDGDDGDIYDIWNVTVKDIERTYKILTPNVHVVMDDVRQPLIP